MSFRGHTVPLDDHPSTENAHKPREAVGEEKTTIFPIWYFGVPTLLMKTFIRFLNVLRYSVLVWLNALVDDDCHEES